MCLPTPAVLLAEVKQGRVPAAETLLDAKADPNAVDAATGETPLFFALAQRQEQPRLLQLLLNSERCCWWCWCWCWCCCCCCGCSAALLLCCCSAALRLLNCSWGCALPPVSSQSAARPCWQFQC